MSTRDLINISENPDSGEPTLESPGSGGGSLFERLFTTVERGARVLRDFQGNDPVENRNTKAAQPVTAPKPVNWYLVAGIAAAVIGLVILVIKRK